MRTPVLKEEAFEQSQRGTNELPGGGPLKLVGFRHLERSSRYFKGRDSENRGLIQNVVWEQQGLPKASS